MELCPPFDGWNLDADGVMHSQRGCRCTPDQIVPVPPNIPQKLHTTEPTHRACAGR